MSANLGKTILGKKIIRTHLSKVTDWNVNREFIRGHILLEKGVFIQVSKGKYFIVIDGQRKGAILKTSPAFRKMKIVIAKAFKSYRKGSKGGQMHHVGYWKSRVIDGMHNCNLFRNSEIKFTENKSNFLKLAS
ncbi:hypothetical protein KBP46_10135 [Chryseobacterium sp. PCH239]|uniref:hypothetical protein n=1 Tax=Chryseobacterium sp. PCH239 TaxID=2825845 RepID=UPI001C12852B|nr:hypothetical protein [Chryseobacterium sp. PCH239]QWT88155.1 hypothetical protein KBP46_10135 [Chryseobacterium sp. PCH239]